ncbi:MAG: hypothetical protein RIS94_3664, partial [Pseudomonadota bacterium]
MTRTGNFLPTISRVALAGALLAAVAPAHAQTMAYGGLDADSGEAAGGDGESKGDALRGGHHARGAGGGGRLSIQPYIQVSQNLLAELQPGNEVLTYTAVSAGVDVAMAGRRTEGAVSVRYERRFVERGNFGDSDTVSGLARVKHDLIPRTLTIEAGGLAARTHVEASGASSLSALANSDAVSQVWSLYAGPALATHVGRVAVNGSYLVGYSRMNQPKAIQIAPGAPRVDLFDHSVAQSAQVSAGVKPGDLLPVGLTASGGWAQEDIANLDQRVREYRAGLQATLPVTMDVALVGDVGWDDVTVSSRDAVRDGAGNPVLGSDGRYKTDKSQPRKIAYQTSGITWDVGVMWRPSRRTSLSVYVGRRYDSTTYYGSFSYAPNSRSSLGINVYDGISGFGSSLTNAVHDLPTDFEVSRNPFSGDIGGCAMGASSGGCVNGVLGSVSSSVFRGRGITATYGTQVGHLKLGIGAGYSRRKFIGAAGTVLAAANGTVDENYFVDAGVSGPIDRHSSFTVAVYDSWYRNGRSSLANVNSYGVNAGYSRQITERLQGTAAVGLEGINRKVAEEVEAEVDGARHRHR